MRPNNGKNITLQGEKKVNIFYTKNNGVGFGFVQVN